MVLLFLGLQKNKPNRRAQGLCFCFFGAVRKNKSNRRAQGLYFWFLWGFQKKTNPIRGQRLKGTFAWEKQTEHMPAVRIRFLPPVRPVRELILYISGSVRFGFPTAGFWAVSGSRGSVPGSRFGSRTFLQMQESPLFNAKIYGVRFRFFPEKSNSLNQWFELVMVLRHFAHLFLLNLEVVATPRPC